MSFIQPLSNYASADPGSLPGNEELIGTQRKDSSILSSHAKEH